ncbi:MAG: dihydrofolate reductase [Clostridiales Family XIII bacterium]|jgi:dihydrofolate reductase|nr:dihydrofolate reductase [Clostridiales Family XIII bacterium]
MGQDRKLTAIAAVDRNWGIGQEGKLLVHLPGDLKYFKEKTKDGIVIMGRKTLESLPGGKPLPNRDNLVLTHDSNFAKKHVTSDALTVCLSLDELFQTLSSKAIGGKSVFVIGGASVYEQLLSYCTTCLITKIDAAFESDRFFPNLDVDARFSFVRESLPQTEAGIHYRFVEYKRIDREAESV